MMKLNYDQALIDLNNKRNENFTLKKGSRKTKVIDEARSEERKYEFRKHRKKEGWVKSNEPKADKELDKWLEDEIRSGKKDEERERKMNRNGRRLILH